jgi:hypothetical protein
MSIVKLNNRGVRSATTFGSISALGEMRFIKKQTASSSSTISFVDGTSDVVLDNTYKEYLFTFKNIHPATDSAQFKFNLSADTGSNYNVTKTTTFFKAYHKEDGSATSLTYESSDDLAQGTGSQFLSSVIDNDNDACWDGMMRLFNPSSTTFVKHFISTGASLGATQVSYNDFVAGYGNTTSAVDAVQFTMSSGNIDAGDICLYGIN